MDVPRMHSATLATQSTARMRCVLILIALSVAAARADAGKMDTASVGEARSVIAEALLLEQLEAQHRVSGTYARELRLDLKRELQDVGESTPELRPVTHEALDAIPNHNTTGLAALRD